MVMKLPSSHQRVEGSLSDSTQDLIQLARSTSNFPFSETVVPFLSIYEQLLKATQRYDQEPYYTFFDDHLKKTVFTGTEFSDKIHRLMSLFQAHGLESGQRLATAGHNHPDMICTYFAAWSLGCSVVPINMTEDDSRIQYIIQHAKPTLIISLPFYANKITSLSDGQGKIIQSTDELFQLPLGRLPVENQLHAEALMIFTSGTTGHPKGVVLSQYQLLVDAKAISEWHQITSKDSMLCVLPIHHVNGTVVTHVTPLVAEAKIVLYQKFTSDGFFSIIRDEKITVTSVVPTLLQFLLQSDAFYEFKKTSLRHIICGAGPLTVELAQKFEDKFSLPVIHGYGLSETTCYSCFLPIDLSQKEHQHWMRDYGFPSIGVPIPCNEMAIWDEKGESKPPGEKGEIVIRGHNVMNGYYENPTANESAFEMGWFHSGDEGFYQSDEKERSFFFITGRFKELIIRGGVNLSPLEIDEVIQRCPGVKAGISVGFDNDWYGEEVGAYVQKADQQLSEADVIKFCAQHLPFSKQPKVVVFGDQIPVTSTGKFQRNKVKNLFLEYKELQFKK